MTPPVLPIHPFTGLQAIGARRDGRPIWPVMGGDGTTPPPPTSPPAAPPASGGDPAPTADPPPQDDKPLGPAGERALAAEREARKALEREVAAFAPLKKLAEAWGAGTPAAQGKSEVELLADRLAQHETALASERDARWRAEVAAEKQLPPGWADRLRGATKEELAADAEAIKAQLAHTAPPAGPAFPAPDPSQGARGSATPDLEAQIKEAQAKGDWRTVMRLQNSKLEK